MADNIRDEFEEYVKQLTTAICKEILLERMEELFIKYNKEVERCANISNQIETQSSELASAVNETAYIVEEVRTEIDNSVKKINATITKVDDNTTLLFNNLTTQLRKDNTENIKAIDEEFEKGLLALSKKLELVVTEESLKDFTNTVEEAQKSTSELVDYVSNILVKEVEDKVSNLLNENAQLLESLFNTVIDNAILKTNTLTSNIKKELDSSIDDVNNSITKVENNTQVLFDDIKQLNLENKDELLSLIEKDNTENIEAINTEFEKGLSSISDKLAEVVTEETLNNFAAKLDEAQKSSSDLVEYVNKILINEIEENLNNLFKNNENFQQELNSRLIENSVLTTNEVINSVKTDIDSSIEAVNDNITKVEKNTQLLFDDIKQLNLENRDELLSRLEQDNAENVNAINTEFEKGISLLSEKLAEVATEESLNDFVSQLAETQKLSNDLIEYIKGVLVNEIENNLNNLFKDNEKFQQDLNAQIIENGVLKTNEAVDSVKTDLDISIEAVNNNITRVENNTQVLFEEIKQLNLENRDELLTRLEQDNTENVNAINSEFEKGISSLSEKLAEVITQKSLDEFINTLEQNQEKNKNDVKVLIENFNQIFKLELETTLSNIYKQSEEFQNRLDKNTIKSVEIIRRNLETFKVLIEQETKTNIDKLDGVLEEQRNRFKKDLKEILEKDEINRNKVLLELVKMVKSLGVYIKDSDRNFDKIDSEVSLIKQSNDELLKAYDESTIKTNEAMAKGVVKVENKIEYLFEKQVENEKKTNAMLEVLENRLKAQTKQDAENSKNKLLSVGILYSNVIVLIFLGFTAFSKNSLQFSGLIYMFFGVILTIVLYGITKLIKRKFYNKKINEYIDDDLDDLE